MPARKLVSVGYLFMVVNGLLAVVSPRLAIKLNARLWLSAYENPGDLEPRDWYVSTTRVMGLGMLVSGVTGLLLEGKDGPEPPLPEEEDEEPPLEESDEA